jgi:hypothetical protein
MALQAISDFEHQKLIKRLAHLPLPTDKASHAEQQLNRFYEEYHSVLMSLAQVIASYREVAAVINERQPLVKKKEEHKR